MHVIGSSPIWVSTCSRILVSTCGVLLGRPSSDSPSFQGPHMH